MTHVNHFESDGENPTRCLCLRVVAELDPSALPRILAYFHNLNVIPRRVVAERASSEALHIRIDVAGLQEDRLSLIAGKVAQLPGVDTAFWHVL
jgi:hypothetical protein